MKKLIFGLTFAVISFNAPSAWATDKIIKLSVPGMSCASCPYIVKQAVSAVEGVVAVNATIEDRSATVTFDDSKTNIGLITAATADIGYPSTLVNEEPTG